MGDIKQTNFRIDSESADVFRQFCEEQGYNQAQGFDHLIQVLELNRAKAGIEGRLTEITTFEEYIKKILDAYLYSLQVAQDTEERIREDYKTDMALRDKAIADYEIKIINRDEKIRTLTEDIQTAHKTEEEAVKNAQNAEKQALSAKEIAAEKGRVNEMLSAKLADAEEKLNGYDELKTSEESLKKQISDMQHKISMLEAELKSQTAASQHLLEEQKKENDREKEIAVERAVAKTEKEMLEKITAIREEKISLQHDLEEQKRLTEQLLAEQKRECEQAKELAVERAVTQTEKKMQEQSDILKEEKTRLQIQLEMLQKDNP